MAITIISIGEMKIMNKRKVLVTGGAGFFDSTFIHFASESYADMSIENLIVKDMNQNWVGIDWED